MDINHITSYASSVGLLLFARLIPPDATATYIHTFFIAPLDYLGSLYAGLPVRQLRCLYRPGHRALLRASLNAFPNYMLDCWMCSTGSHLNRRSRSGS